MYENEIRSVILERMLDRIDSKFDKREGSIIWDALGGAAVELGNFYKALTSLLDEVYADTCTRKFLIRRCAERGITPKPASYAIVQGEFTPTELDVPIGSRFSHEDYNYAVTEKVSNGIYLLQCETIGADVNGLTGQLIPIDYVKGLQTAYITETVIPGEDEESTESLRARYFASVSAEAFGGNKLDYKTKVLTISGVGGVKVYSGAEWNGGGTVKIVFIDSDHNPPTDELVDKVQGVIDPEVSYKNGEGVTATSEAETGVGVAPIGHIVSVVGAYNTVVNVDMMLTYASGYNWDKVKGTVEESIDNYFATLNKNWSSYDKIRVRIAQLESQILNIQGIIDVQQTKLNGKEENLAVDKDSLVSRGTVNGN